MNKLTVRFELSEREATVCCNAIGLEASAVKHSRSNVRLYYDRALVLDVEARDLHAMRAAVNTYLRWIDMTCKLMTKP
jgi:tRNA threonylcarbamoyladenosine modification (KEOPS) complex  Pcc1 subunit